MVETVSFGEHLVKSTLAIEELIVRELNHAVLRDENCIGPEFAVVLTVLGQKHQSVYAHL